MVAGGVTDAFAMGFGGGEATGGLKGILTTKIGRQNFGKNFRENYQNSITG